MSNKYRINKYPPNFIIHAKLKKKLLSISPGIKISNKEENILYLCYKENILIAFILNESLYISDKTLSKEKKEIEEEFNLYFQE